MSAANRVLVVSALVAGLCPALAFACEDETSAKATASAEATAKATACAEATVKSTACTVQVKVVCKEGTTTAEVTETKCQPKVLNTQGARHSGWEPGHLIEPDSMRLGPDLKAPDTEQWVTISSRSGVIRFHRYPWSAKKTEGRTLQQYGPYRS
jgi:hypothetical protein